MTNKTKIIVGVGGALLLALLVWYFWPSAAAPAPEQNTPSFGAPAGSRDIGSNSPSDPGGTPEPLAPKTNRPQIIFSVSEEPVTGATFVQTSNPTTTLARFVMQENGHVYDLPLDVPGAILRPVSNTTILGTRRAIWLEGGGAVLVQYVEGQSMKTVYIGFAKSTAATAGAGAERVQFLPDDIVDIAASPDGKKVAYIVKNKTLGVDGYTAASDGSGVKKLFSMPLSQLLISWPNQGTLLLQTPSYVGVAGVVFVVGATSGAIVPLIYGQGITAIGNQDFSQIIYQTRLNGESNTYAHSTRGDIPVSGGAFPEKCIWGSIATSTLYCSIPYEYTAPNYLDLYHQGVANQPEDIFAIDVHTGNSYLVAAPGVDGGEAAAVAESAISPDERYLLYTTRGERSLWGVRLQN